MTQAAPDSFLDGYLPIRRILKDGIAQQFVRDLNIDTASLSVIVDLVSGTVTIAAGDNNVITDVQLQNRFGAKGDGVTNDTAAIAAALASIAGTGGAVVLGPKTYVVSSLTLPAGCSLIGHGDVSVLKTTSNATVVQMAGQGCHCEAFKILGNGVGANQNGISNGAYPGGPSYEKTRIINCSFETIANAGVFAAGGGDFLQHGMLVMGCRFANCGFAGIWTLLEYSRLIGNDIEQCAIGIRIQAGNVIVSGGTICNGTTGVHVVGGGNDGHGMVTGVNINHNTTNVLIDNALANGMPFVGCNIYGAATGMSFVSSVGARFIACSISDQTMSFDGSTGTHFQSCLFAGTNVLNHNVNGHASKTIFGTDNVTLDGLGDQLAYTFPGDANQVLTVAQSVKKTIVVASGVITATRKLTSALDATIGQRVLVRNLNAQAVQWAWASGAAITIAAGAAAWVGSNGTDAISLGTMT